MKGFCIYLLLFNGTLVIKELSQWGIQQLASSMLIGCLTRRSSRRNERAAKFMAGKGHYKIERTSVNSFRYQQF